MSSPRVSSPSTPKPTWGSSVYWFDTAYEAVARFMDMGGNVLWLIAIVLFMMWMLIFERVYYFYAGWRKDAGTAIAVWEGRSERKSWEAHQIRRKLIADAHGQINQYLPLIKTLVALCPLLGLLGTVTGMIEVFNIMAVTGGGDAKSADLMPTDILTGLGLHLLVGGNGGFVDPAGNAAAHRVGDLARRVPG